jgi:hypothetical protein
VPFNHVLEVDDITFSGFVIHIMGYMYLEFTAYNVAASLNDRKCFNQRNCCQRDKLNSRSRFVSNVSLGFLGSGKYLATRTCRYDSRKYSVLLNGKFGTSHTAQLTFFSLRFLF